MCSQRRRRAGLLDRLHEVGPRSCRRLSGCVPSRVSTSGPRFSVDDASGSTGETGVTRARDSDLAHILFTSGSTGTPKGVGITHANVIHFVEWARSYFGLREDDRLSGHSPFHFDLSTFDIYGTLAAGARTSPRPAGAQLASSETLGVHSERPADAMVFRPVGDGAAGDVRRRAPRLVQSPAPDHLVR